MRVWVTRHGPLLINDAKEHLALRWAAAEPRAFQFPFPQLNRAGNWQEFTAALARFPGPGQNFVYADVDGNIGYHATGLLPIRKNYAGDVPVDGSSGNFEWQGFIPFDELPSFYNPPRGVIVTANQNPFPPDYAYTVNGNFASPPATTNVLESWNCPVGTPPAGGRYPTVTASWRLRRNRLAVANVVLGRDKRAVM